jgi:signal transduction histidine kinase
MSADVLIRNLTWLFYLFVFLYVTGEALRDSRRANIDIALFFGLTALVIMSSVLADLRMVPTTSLLGALNGTLVLSLSYVLLRLVDDFATVPRWLLLLALALLGPLCGSLFVFNPPRPGWLIILQVAYFVGIQTYGAAMFIRTARRSAGVTRRRMTAVAVGSGLLGLTILTASLQSFDPQWGMLSRICGLASGVSYLIGFAPPRALRRAWQEPELRAFLGRAATLPRLPTTKAIIRALEHGAATSVGAPNARIGVWEQATNNLLFDIDGEVFSFPVTNELPAGQTLLTQQPRFVADVTREAPAYADLSRVQGSIAILMAPITAGEERLGVLTVSAPRAPLFARDDLELVQLLADQAAVILESRALIDEAAQVQAREQATRLKDDFLSAAAHDLKTPLTALLGRAQLLERRALRNPQAPTDLAAVQSIIAETQRLKSFVLELLDASRAERGQLVGHREETDLRRLVAEAVQRREAESQRISVTMHEAVIGLYDCNRIMQLLENLLENATKYSAKTGEIHMRVWQEDGTGHLTVSDQGVGIPPADVEHIFDRFYRGTNVDDRRFAGLGLGLYICRGIVEQHGGQIWATSELGKGTTMHVTLPTTHTRGHDAYSSDFSDR